MSLAYVNKIGGQHDGVDSSVNIFFFLQHESPPFPPTFVSFLFFSIAFSFLASLSPLNVITHVAIYHHEAG